jgi:predicted naringenin-chalcone synthase
MDQQGLWDEFFRDHYAGSRMAERIWRSSGVVRRHGAVDPRVEDVSGLGTGARMERYLGEAMPLGKDAVTGALDAAGVAADDVGLFAVVSCTGYATPGVDILLARDLGMSADVQRLLVGHMGCYAALPGLGAVADTVAARGLTAVLLCVELPSLHVQPATDEVEQMVAHALFSDAAAAVVVAPDAHGLQVVDTVARTDVGHQDHMTWDITDHGFRMGLSARVPDVLARHVHDVVTGLLAKHDLTIADVDGWAVHPGGPRILDVCADKLGLPEGALDASRATLRDYGNCSSATVLLVLDELRRRTPIAVGGHVVMLAFGPGLTLYATLLRQT